MGKRRELSENERQTVIGMPNTGFSLKDVVQEYNVHPSSIRRLINQVRTNGNVNDRQRSDCSRTDKIVSL